jgi:hypothetical protein
MCAGRLACGIRSAGQYGRVPGAAQSCYDGRQRFESTHQNDRLSGMCDRRNAAGHQLLSPVELSMVAA